MIRLNCVFQANDGEQYKTALEFMKYSPMMRQCGQMKVEKFNNT